MPRWSPLRDPVPWALCALYAVVFSVLGAVRYNAHRNFVDLGIFAQTAASAFGCFCNTIEGNHWAVHFSPVLYLAGAVLRVWHSALALVVLQAVAGALTIPPIYGIVAHRHNRGLARLAALVVFLYPPLAGVTFNDFHENGFAPAAIAWMFWAFDGGHLAIMAVAALAAIAIKEDQAIFVAISGLLGAWRFRGTMHGIVSAILAGTAIAVGAVYFGYVQPHMATGGHWTPVRFYAWTPADFAALFPGGIVQRLGFVLLAFGPLLFLPFRVRMIVLAAAPLAEVLLSRMSTTFTIGSHYAGAWTGYVLFAFTYALCRMPAPRVRTTLIACAALCALEFAVADPLHPGQTLRARTQADAGLDAFLATLPATFDVATQEEAYTHLAATDPHVTLLPETPSGTVTACYMLTDGAFPNSPRLVESAPLVARLARSGAYRVERRAGAIVMYVSTACR